MNQLLTKICFIGTYFGKWPVWFPAFLVSCAKNSTIDWVFVTDCDIPPVTYPNVRFKQMSLEELNELASRKLGFYIQKAAYSQVDLQPAYGVIFEEYYHGYDFWGHCDIDVIWGDIRSFFSETILANYDIVSCRKDFLAGHLTLWKNVPEINRLFQSIPCYRDVLSSGYHHSFDESVVSTYLRRHIAKGESDIRVYWPENRVVWFHGDATPDGWYWENGRIFDVNQREHVYLHFQDWKKSLVSIDFGFGDDPTKFAFTQDGIRVSRPDVREQIGAAFRPYSPRQVFTRSTIAAKLAIRRSKMMLSVNNLWWAQKLIDASISPRDVQYEPKTGRLLLKPLGLSIAKKNDFFLSGYHWALDLTTQSGADFAVDEQDELCIKIAGLRAQIRCVDDLRTLKRLFVDRVYSLMFTEPAVVVDIGMQAGLSALFFSAQSDVFVVGYEPLEEQYHQAQHNLSINPALASKIEACKADVGEACFRSIAIFPPKLPDRVDPSAFRPKGITEPEFEYEEIEVEDAAHIVDSVSMRYPGRQIVVKIDYGCRKYYVDGASEFHAINRLHRSGKLAIVDAIILEWYRSKLHRDPSVMARQLSDFGFAVFLLNPDCPERGMLYAVRKTGTQAPAFDEQQFDLGAPCRMLH